MSSLPDVTFLYGRARALGSPTAGDPMNTVMIERGCFLGLGPPSRRARGPGENLAVGSRVLGGFHSHTGDDGDANLSPTDLDYVADELRRIGRTREPDGAAWVARRPGPR